MVSLQELKQANETEASLFGGGFNFGTVQLNQTEQEIRTDVDQILSSVCSADVNALQSNNLVYARNSSTGDISFIQDGNAEADCIITNAAIADFNLSQKGDQRNTLSAAGSGIIGLIVAIVIIIVIIGAISKLSKASKVQKQFQAGGLSSAPAPSIRRVGGSTSGGLSRQAGQSLQNVDLSRFKRILR